MDEMSLKNKVAIVVGGAKGMGKAGAIAYAKEGAKVCVADINKEEGKRTVEFIKDHGGEAFFVSCDVSKGNEIEEVIKKTMEQYGHLDCAFNNTDIEPEQKANVIDMEEKVWDHIMDVNAKGTWLCMKYEIPAMLKNGGGTIVNNASLAGIANKNGMPAYTVSKHAIIGMTKSAARDFASNGIRVNAVCPTYRELSPKFEKDILAKNVADAVVFLSSDGLSYTNGTYLSLDGGFALGTAAMLEN